MCHSNWTFQAYGPFSSPLAALSPLQSGSALSPPLDLYTVHNRNLAIKLHIRIPALLNRLHELLPRPLPIQRRGRRDRDAEQGAVAT